MCTMLSCQIWCSMHYLVNNGGKNLRELEEPVTRTWIRNGVRNVYGTEICARLPMDWTQFVASRHKASREQSCKYSIACSKSKQRHSTAIDNVARDKPCRTGTRIQQLLRQRSMWLSNRFDLKPVKVECTKDQMFKAGVPISKNSRHQSSMLRFSGWSPCPSTLRNTNWKPAASCTKLPNPGCGGSTAARPPWFQPCSSSISTIFHSKASMSQSQTSEACDLRLPGPQKYCKEFVLKYISSNSSYSIY